MTHGADEKLARVTYLPGVLPPAAVPVEPLATASVVPPSPSATMSVASPSTVTEPVERRGVGLDGIEGLVRASELGKSDLPGKRLAARGIRPDESGPEPESAGERSARAHNVSMHALTRRGVSSAEMTTLLRSRELDEADVTIEVSRLERVGLLDDRELAATLVRTLRERKGLGRSALTAELRRRRIDPAAIEEALADLGSAEGTDELTRARELAVKRAPQLRSLDAETARRRLGAFLMRKGYSGSIVASAVASALGSGAEGAGRARGPRFE